MSEPDTQVAAQPDWHSSANRLKEHGEQINKRLELYLSERTRREANLNAVQPAEEDLTRCDSSFKKNNGLIRKLKTVTLKDKDSLCVEIQKVNQSKYVSEVVTAIAESQIKGKDIPAAVEVCCLLHQRYAEFGSGLKEALLKNYLARSENDDMKLLSANRRSCLRLMLEMHLSGVFDSWQVLHKIVKELVTGDYVKDPEVFLMNVVLLTQFARAGRTQLLNMPPQPSLSLHDFPVPTKDDAPEEVHIQWKEVQLVQKEVEKETEKRYSVSENEATEVRSLMSAAAEKWFETFLSEHKKLRDLENDNTQVLNAKGELPEALAADYSQKRQAFENLQRTMTSFAECLDLSMPEPPDEGIKRMSSGVIQVVDVSDDKESNLLFDDSETREFYEILPDLRSSVPRMLLGNVSEEREETGVSAEASEQDPETPVVSPKTPEDSDASKQKSAAAHKKMDGLLLKLRNCYTRDAADDIATEFCSMNSKSTRKRLIRALCDIPKGCLPLIPFYGRVTATLHQVFTDIATGIVAQLEQDFSTLLAKKEPGTYTLEQRITNMRYMGELCKFKLINYGTVFTCLKKLLDDFTHMNIDAACALIETAGSYLVRLPETQGRMENRLEQMNRLKNAKNLDSRHRALIDSAYFQCKPPKSGVRRKRRPVLHEYIRHLIFTVLAEGTFRDVLKKLRGLTWEKDEPYLIHCLLKANVKLYAQTPLVASLCSGLAKYHDSLAVNVVDSVFEELQSGMENPSVGLYQHRVAHVRFLGELYNYKLIDSRTVFETLYWVITFGRGSAEEMQKLDPPGDAFRIKMVCTILETCGRYFGKGTAKKKLDRFLTYFQRYILSKPPLSMDIEFELSDIFEKLRPDLYRFESFDEANKAVEAIEAELITQEGRSLSWIMTRGEKCDVETGKSGSEAEEEDGVEEEAEEKELLEGVELDDDDDVIEHGRKPISEVDLEFEENLQALLQEYQRLTPAQIKPVECSQEEEDAAPIEKMPFKVLLKRSGRDDTTHQLSVPMSVTMAVRQKEHDAQEAADRSLIKERVLAAHEKHEEEELMEARIFIRHGRGQHRSYDGSHGGGFYGGRHYRRR